MAAGRDSSALEGELGQARQDAESAQADAESSRQRAGRAEGALQGVKAKVCWQAAGTQATASSDAGMQHFEHMIHTFCYTKVCNKLYGTVNLINQSINLCRVKPCMQCAVWHATLARMMHQGKGVGLQHACRPEQAQMLACELLRM